MSIPPLSYSSLKMYELCPRKYHETYIKKSVPFEETDQTRYGDRFHKAAQVAVERDVAMPPEFCFADQTIQAIKHLPGRKHTEMKLGVNAELKPVTFFARDVWMRGAADLISSDDESKVAYVADYKTGKDTFADRDQLTLMSLFVFSWFKSVEIVKSALVFVVKDSMLRHKMTRDDAPAAWDKYRERVEALDQSFKADVWNPKQNFTCSRYCQVHTCEYWRQ